MNNSGTCRWYNVCPIKRFYEEGKIGKHWVEDYCLKNNPNCVRKKMESQGIYHPDNMMPDGDINDNLR